MIKLILFSQMNHDKTEVYINPEDISSIEHASDGPNNEGQTIIDMRNETSFNITGFAQEIIQMLIKEGDIRV